MTCILLAEDDDAMREFLTLALQREGYEVIACSDGLTALQHVMEEPGTIHALLTDIVMPGMDGVELARKAQAYNPVLVVMYITGFAGIALDKTGNGPTHARVLSKPFHLREMLKNLTEALDNRQRKGASS
jgi:two-component system cell cycle response regulator CpdR